LNLNQQLTSQVSLSYMLTYSGLTSQVLQAHTHMVMILPEGSNRLGGSCPRPWLDAADD
jgi:hypothetical protein